MTDHSHHLVTRTSKHNDRDHQGLADGTAEPEQHLPRYFAKNGHVDADPKKIKKDGAGKGNWGRGADDAFDGSFNLAKPRRHSNSFVADSKDFKSKFEANEDDPVFDESVHGPLIEEDEAAELDLDKHSTSESSSMSSAEDSIDEHKME